jgi:predicted small lipoprotein YifL
VARPGRLKSTVPAPRPACSALAAALALAALAACGTSGPKPPAPPPPVPRAPTVSYDWQPLVLAPFDTLFHDMPIPLTEVIEFQEPGDAPPGEQCFRPKRGIAPPPFLGRAPDDYLLCFVRDKLVRIEAAVRLPQAEAPAIFAAACEDWHATAATRTADACEGSARDIAFSARSAAAAAERADPGASDAPSPAASSPPESTVSISLTRAAP